jgi:hypothetical protein
MAIETLIGIRSEDLESAEPEVRRKALETRARNERIVLGRVSPVTVQALRLIEQELASLSGKPQ